MEPLRILIIEDDSKWIKAIKESLRDLRAKVEVATVREDALQRVRDNSYNLITVDLSLVGSVPDPDAAGFEVLDILDQLRRGSRKRVAGVVVLTGHFFQYHSRLEAVIRFRKAHRLLKKDDFHLARFRGAIQEVLLEARVEEAQPVAAEELEGRRSLAINFLDDCWIGARLNGDRHADYFASPPVELDAAELANRADQLGRSIEAEWAKKPSSGIWRPAARELGTDLMARLRDDPEVARILAIARDGLEESEMLRLQMVGPPTGLRLPFELLRDNVDFLALSHVMTRKVMARDFPLDAREQSFRSFLRRLKRNDESLRILIVGADASGTGHFLSSVRKEARVVTKIAKLELESRLGLRVAEQVLIGKKANLRAIRRALEGPDGCHLLHYAGHGIFDPENPEQSGPILFKGKGYLPLSAPELGYLARASKLRMVVLSGCSLGATAAQAGRGDYLGPLDALVKAGVPWVLGHRWMLPDRAAVLFTQLFYHSLWRFLDPGLAVLKARQGIANQDDYQRDNPIWASSILVSQL